MSNFIITAMISGGIISALAAPLGCIIIWSRLSFYGDALSHGAILGIVLGLALDMGAIGAILAITFICLIFAYIVYATEKQQSSDNILAILSYSSLAFGIILLDYLGISSSRIYSFLFGDILSISGDELSIIIVLATISAIIFIYNWRSLLMISLHSDMAQISGISVKTQKIIFMSLVAIIISSGIYIMGAMLIVSLLIIPPSTARAFSRTPERMIILAIIFGILSVIGGIGASYIYDLPASPAIVAMSSIFFLGSFLKNKI